jgi:hypothetical protein
MPVGVGENPFVYDPGAIVRVRSWVLAGAKDD